MDAAKFLSYARGKLTDEPGYVLASCSPLFLRRLGGILLQHATSVGTEDRGGFQLNTKLPHKNRA